MRPSSVSRYFAQNRGPENGFCEFEAGEAGARRQTRTLGQQRSRGRKGNAVAGRTTATTTATAAATRSSSSSNRRGCRRIA